MRNAFLLAFLLSPGFAFAQTTLSATIQSGGLTREYLLYVPAAYTGAEPVPLVFNLHGYGSYNLQQIFYGEFRPIADTANFLLAVPNGTLDASGQRYWSVGQAGATVDDVGFLRDLLDTLQAAYNIDPDRVYSAGMSNGGAMSYRLACELSDRIAAVASVTGFMTAGSLAACNPPRPVPVMEVHGTADPIVPYEGSVLPVPVPTLVDFWADHNHCNPVPTVMPVPNVNTTDGCTAERHVYAGGENGSSVEHYKVLGGEHTWPGAIVPIGVTNYDFSASSEIWRFFSQYKLDQLSPSAQPARPAATWTARPNPAREYVVLETMEAEETWRRLRVFDVVGRLIEEMPLTSDQRSVRLETEAWKVGVYVAILEGEGEAKRLMVVKAVH
jgi:polyhydroxybutyrate depolymerase